MATKAEALMKFLAGVANHLGVGKHAYVVGGAVRNWLMGLPPTAYERVASDFLSDADDFD